MLLCLTCAQAAAQRGEVETRKRRAAAQPSDEQPRSRLGAAARWPLQRGCACVGRKVLVPAHLWPDYTCDEHGGDGWEAQVTRCVRGRATVRFLHAKDAQGDSYPDEHLDVSVLTPLASPRAAMPL